MHELKPALTGMQHACGASTRLDALLPVLRADRLHTALPVGQAKVYRSRLQYAGGIDLAHRRRAGQSAYSSWLQQVVSSACNGHRQHP